MHHPRLGACSGGVKETVGWWSVTPTNGSPISIIQFEEPLNSSTHKWAVLGPLCYKLITIVNCYLEAGLTCFVYCPKALYLVFFIVWHLL